MPGPGHPPGRGQVAPRCASAARGTPATLPRSCRTWTRTFKLGTALTVARCGRRASCAHAGATTTAASVTEPTRGRTPGTRRRDPSRPSSAIKARPSSDWAGNWQSAAMTPRPMARSRPEPALRKPDGARLTVTRFWGHLNPLEIIAARTRSRDSLQEASGKPTTRKPGSPLLTWTSTATGWPSTPTSVAEDTVANTGHPRKSCELGLGSGQSAGHEQQP